MNNKKKTKINNQNISFFLNDNKNDTSSLDLNILIDNFDNISNSNSEINLYEKDNSYLAYYKHKNSFLSLEDYYKTITTKDLIKICEYYKIKKLKGLKKEDLIGIITCFEEDLSNYEIVLKRNTMWAYLYELLNDENMKKYILWG
jgi:hypothetical protein